VSQPLASQQDAEDEASDAAYEAIASDLAARGPWLDSVAPSILDQREQVFAAYGRDSLSTQARRDVTDGRRAVARVMKRGAPPVAGRYWEAFDTGEGRRYVAFAQINIAGSELDKVRAKAQVTANALGATAVDYFAELGWRYPKLEHGAVVTKLERGPLQAAGLAEHNIVLAIDGHDVVDAASFAKVASEEYAALVDHGGTLRMLVQTDSGDPRELATSIAGKAVDVVVPPTRPKGPRGTGRDNGSGGVNIWDRVGGSNHAGRDDPTQ
jgi:hypothetical protein